MNKRDAQAKMMHEERVDLFGWLSDRDGRERLGNAAIALDIALALSESVDPLCETALDRDLFDDVMALLHELQNALSVKIQQPFLIMMYVDTLAVHAGNETLGLKSTTGVKSTPRRPEPYQFSQSICDIHRALKGPGGYAFAEIPSFYGDVRESESGKVRSALEEIDWIVERYPCRTGAYYRRGRAYHSWGELERAIDDYTRAIKLCSTFGEAYYCRGEAYDDKGNRSQAIADCKRATELKPGHKFERTKANIKNLQLRESDLHAPFGESMPVEYLEGQIHVTLEEARQRVHEAMLTVDPNYERVSDRIGYTSAVVWQHRGEYHVRLKNAGALLSRYVEAIQTALGESCGVIDED